MARKQILIALGVMAAMVACLLVLAFNPAAPPILERDDSAARLAFAARWLLVPGLCLLAGVGVTASRRFFSQQAIDGGASGLERSLDINLRYNLNTLEQTVLAAIAWTGLALTLPAQDLRIIPALAGLFAAGRVAFWIGYLAAPWARAFGLGLTFYPTAAAFAWLAFKAMSPSG